MITEWTNRWSHIWEKSVCLFSWYWLGLVGRNWRVSNSKFDVNLITRMPVCFRKWLFELFNMQEINPGTELGWLCCGLGRMFSYINTLFTGGTVLASLACAWLISIRLLGAEQQQLLIVITIYLNNEAAGALYWQTKGQKLAEKSRICVCMSVCAWFVCRCCNDIFYHWMHVYLHSFCSLQRKPFWITNPNFGETLCLIKSN